MITAKKLIKGKIISIRPEASMLEAYRVMFEKNIRHLPVISDDHVMVGMLSDRDVQRAMVVDKVDANTQEIFLNAEKKVSDYMSWPIYSLLENSSISLVIDKMIEKKISSMIVVSEDGECSGIITTDDILKFIKLHLRHDEEVLQRPVSYLSSNILF